MNYARGPAQDQEAVSLLSGLLFVQDNGVLIELGCNIV